MRSRAIVGAAFVAAVLTMAAAAVSAVATQKSAEFQFDRPTLIAGVGVEGDVIIVHDADRMAKGEACTTVYRSDRGRRGKMLVEFMCQPVARAAAPQFRVRCRTLSVNQDRLTEYQFEDDTEAHGVPLH